MTHFLNLFAAQSLCALLIIWNGLPVYRCLVHGLRDQATALQIAIVLGCVVIMQAAYWLAYRIQPGLTFRRRVVLGHVLLALAELTFLFPATLTAVALFDQSINLETEWWRLLVLVVALFAMFCMKRQLETVGSAMTRG